MSPNPPTHALLTRKPFNIPAIAAFEQRFDSEKVAINQGQQVMLEFTPTQITVHDPFRISPSEHNKLGWILYSYSFSPWNKEFSMDIAADSGVVSKSMAFSFLQIVHHKDRSECSVCGRIFLPPKGKKKAQFLLETENHLAEHYASKR